MMETYHQIKLHHTIILKYINLLNSKEFEVMKIFSREKKYYFNDWLEVKLLIDIAQSSKFISINKK